MEIKCHKFPQVSKNKDPISFEIFAREICKVFVYKHSEKIEYVKN